MRRGALLVALLLCAERHACAAVTVNCTVSAGSIAFASYNPLSPSADTSTGSLIVICSGSGSGSSNVSVNLTLSTGLSGNFANRTMVSGTNLLNYNIYWSAAYAQIMGDGNGGSFAGSAGPFSVRAGGSSQATGTMYGRVPAQQNVAPGSYTDIITVTVTY